MIEVLWHGRGGQGAFTAARILGAAASFADGRYALAFPSFGPERRGAPMRAFTKMADEPIGDRSAVSQANYVIYLDDTLFGDDWEEELVPGGVIIVNSVRCFADPRVVAIDANGISQEILGRPIPNTALLGALCAVCDCVSADDVKAAIEGYMPAKLHDANKRVVDAAVEACRASRAAAGEGSATEGMGEAAGGEDAAAPTTSAPAAAELARPACRIPALRDDALDPEAFARTTCFEGGYLVAKNAGWRNKRPVVDAQACTNCLQCYLYCPDGTVYRTQDGQGVGIDYDFCKGCGVCAKLCRFGAIAMVSESEVA